MKQQLKNTNTLSTVLSIVIAVLLGCLLILLVSDEPLSAIKDRKSVV